VNGIDWSKYLVATSPLMQRLMGQVERALDSNSTILIVGATGTGKNHLAETIHKAGKNTKNGPFILVNCGALSERESELFALPRNSPLNPIRQAKHGSLFLDEIQDTPYEHQTRLVRLLQEATDQSSQKEKPRIIASSSIDLYEAVRAGKFRDDLYFRIRVLDFSIPLLRDRKKDIPPLAYRFLSEFAQGKSLTARAVDSLINYDWPGNVRDLKNTIERAVLLTWRESIEAEDLFLTEKVSKTHPSSSVVSFEHYSEIMAEGGYFSIKKATRELERALIRRALEKTGGNRTQAAKILEISHRAFLYKLKEYDIA